MKVFVLIIRFTVNFVIFLVSSSALILYNHAGTGLDDFISLEIIDERLRFSYRIEDINSNR